MRTDSDTIEVMIIVLYNFRCGFWNVGKAHCFSQEFPRRVRIGQTSNSSRHDACTLQPGSPRRQGKQFKGFFNIHSLWDIYWVPEIEAKWSKRRSSSSQTFRRRSTGRSPQPSDGIKAQCNWNDQYSRVIFSITLPQDGLIFLVSVFLSVLP